MSKLYPPYVESTLPAQAVYEDGGRGLKIPFRFNRAVSPVSVVKVCARIKTVSTNSWVGTPIETTDFPMQLGSDFYVANFTELGDIQLTPGQYYKIQLAFIDAAGTLGYYSTVGVFKYTTRPSVSIEGLGDNNISNLYTYVGLYAQNEDGQDVTEKIYTYRFDLFEGSTIVATSGVQLHDSTQDKYSDSSRDIWVINQQLKEGFVYQIQYSVTTINGLEASSPRYNITNSELPYDADNALEPYLKFENNFENGYIRLYSDMGTNILKASGGGFVISRASSKDNFATWYDLMKFTLAGSDIRLPNEFFKDFSVEQGISYKYALQRYNDSGFYTSRLLFSAPEDITEKVVVADFEDMFLYDGDRQLKVRFNPKVSSFKSTVLESKMDTIGGKHPFIFRNGNVKYKEFAVSGLISYLADMDELFMSDAELGLSQQDMHRHSTPSEAEWSYRARGTQVDTINMAAERNFKLEALEWLTNGKPKLFRSPGEGNYIVRLLNVSLSPNDTVARMLHTFSSTAYEIADCTFENLIKYGFVEEKTINNEILIFESVNFKASAANNQVAMYNADYLDSYKANGGVYYAEFKDATPGAVFTLKFLHGRGDLTIQIPYNGTYTVNIFDEPLVSVRLNSIPEEAPYLYGSLDVGYYGTTTVKDFGDIRKVAISDENYVQYGRCDYQGVSQHKQYYDVSNNTINALDDIKFKAGYFYYLKAETRYSKEVLYVSDGKYYDNPALEPTGLKQLSELDLRFIYTVKDPDSGAIKYYLDGNTKQTMNYPTYTIQIQLNNSDKLETIQLGNYDSAGSYVLPAMSSIKQLIVGSGVWIECVYQQKEYIYCVEEDNPSLRSMYEQWVQNGSDRSTALYDSYITALKTVLLNT